MIMNSQQVAVSELKGGDILKRQGRVVVISAADTETVTYGGSAHTVTLVKGLDALTQKPVQWLAVPDQPVMVIR
jgi:hypothetical protein